MYIHKHIMQLQYFQKKLQKHIEMKYFPLQKLLKLLYELLLLFLLRAKHNPTFISIHLFSFIFYILCRKKSSSNLFTTWFFIWYYSLIMLTCIAMFTIVMRRAHTMFTRGYCCNFSFSTTWSTINSIWCKNCTWTS